MEGLVGAAMVIALLSFGMVAICAGVYLLMLVWKLMGFQVLDKKRQLELQQEREQRENEARKERAMAGRIVGVNDERGRI